MKKRLPASARINGHSLSKLIFDPCQQLPHHSQTTLLPRPGRISGSCLLSQARLSISLDSTLSSTHIHNARSISATFSTISGIPSCIHRLRIPRPLYTLLRQTSARPVILKPATRRNLRGPCPSPTNATERWDGRKLSQSAQVKLCQATPDLPPQRSLVREYIPIKAQIPKPAGYLSYSTQPVLHSYTRLELQTHARGLFSH